MAILASWTPLWSSLKYVNICSVFCHETWLTYSVWRGRILMLVSIRWLWPVVIIFYNFLLFISHYHLVKIARGLRLWFMTKHLQNLRTFTLVSAAICVQCLCSKGGMLTGNMQDVSMLMLAFSSMHFCALLQPCRSVSIAVDYWSLGRNPLSLMCCILYTRIWAWSSSELHQHTQPDTQILLLKEQKSKCLTHVHICKIAK